MFPGWDVDCEYNRDSNVPKRLQSSLFQRDSNDVAPHRDTEGKTVFPDIIVHKRGTQVNLLVVEVKKTTSTVCDDVDIIKLCAFMEELGYKHALFLKLGAGGDYEPPYELRWL